MSTIQVANLHFETTGANRIEYTGNNVVRVRANGGFQLPFGTSAQRANGDVGLIRYNTDTGLVESFGGAGTWDALPSGPVFNVAYGVANAAFARANTALQNTSGTFAGNLNITGNVGIGTMNSGFNLDVSGTFRSLSSNEGIQTTGDTIGRDLLAGRSNVATCIGYVGGAAMVQGTNFSLSATPDLILQPYGGNVGVGTSSPITKLDVDGIGRFLQTASPTTGAVIIRASSGDTNAGHLQFVNNSNSAQYGWIRGIAGGGLAFGSADSTERVRITSGGILGIGTNSPSYTVDAQGTGDISSRFKSSSGGAELLLDATNNFNSIRLFNSGSEKWRAGQVGNANYSIYDSAAGTNRLVVDTSGRVTTPSQPAFYAYGLGENYTITNGADIVFGGTRFNTGNHYNTTNGRFTAPIAGVYCFHWSTFLTGAAGRCSFKLNGADFNGQQLDYSATQSQSMTVYLNAGDYVTVGDWQSISGGSLWLGHSHFSGHLVG